MKRLARAATMVACAILFGLVLAHGQSGAPQAQPPQGPPTFRSGVNVVPVDIRVLDRDGKPVTDLKQEDFTILENGVAQAIRFFNPHDMTPLPAKPDARPAFRVRGGSPMQEQSSRVFLIVMGRGRLQEPAKGVDAVIDFVRNRLMPQDEVAVFAYNRASGFTNNHEKVASILERFRKAHENIEAKLKQQMSGLAAVYGSKDIPASLQGEINAIFGGGATGDSSRQVPPPPETDGGRLAADIQRGVNAAQDAMAGGTVGRAGFVSLDPAGAGMDFDTYVALGAQTMQDVGNLYSGIEYLRYLEGEKHIVFVTEQGLYMPRAETDAGIAARASNARVAIDVIQTGGVDSGPVVVAGGARGAGPAPVGRAGIVAPIPSANFTAVDQFRAMGTRRMADLTGGQAWFYQYARKAVEQIDTSTRFAYLLGYNQPAGRGYRRIVVRVNRPGVTVLYRHGYFTSDDPPPVDRRTYLTNVRLAAAGSYPRDVDDIKLQVKAERRQEGQAAAVAVSVQIDISRVALTKAGDRMVGELDVMVTCGDDRERVIGRLHQKMDLNLRDETYQRFLKEGVSYSATVSVRGEPKYAKVMVYDYDSDLVGSLNVKVK